MNKTHISLPSLTALLTLLVTSVPGYAASLVDGSVAAGETKALTCTACHGQDGNSVNPLWPNIAGQGAPYLLDQLRAYKNGDRNDPLMTSQAMLLSDEDMQNLAVYFESMPAAAAAVADTSTMARAEALYRGGKEAQGIPACLACHGPTGRGNPAANYPALNGQHAAYTAKQLRDYAAGRRQTDGPTRIMRDISSRLTEADIVAIASYVQGLK